MPRFVLRRSSFVQLMELFRQLLRQPEVPFCPRQDISRMGKCDAIFDYAGVFSFAGEDSFEKCFGIIDLSILRE